MALMIAALRYFGSADIGGDCDGFKAVALQNKQPMDLFIRKTKHLGAVTMRFLGCLLHILITLTEGVGWK